MAKCTIVLPDAVIKDFKKIYDNTDRIFGAMTKAGAEVVEQNIRANAPAGIKNSPIMHHLKVSKTYKTPSDGGINNKIAFFYQTGADGYFVNNKKQTVPIDLVLNAFEYGTRARYTSKGGYRGQIVKQPFIRKSFNQRKIEKAMLKAQKEASGGLLDE